MGFFDLFRRKPKEVPPIFSPNEQKLDASGSGGSIDEGADKNLKHCCGECPDSTPDTRIGQYSPDLDPYSERLELATSLQMAGKRREALVILRQIVTENNEHSGAWYALATLFTEINEVGRALHCYEQITRLEPRGLAASRVGELRSIVLKRPDYVWEYNKERGAIK